MRHPILLATLPVVLAASAGVVHADTGASLDFGLVASRVAVTDQTALDATSGRFALRITSSRHVHFGAEAEEGSLRGTTTLPDGVVARTAPGSTSTPGIESPLDGNTLALKFFAGLHTDVGRVRFIGDLAGGVRDTWVSSDAGIDVAGRKNEPLLEARSRVDYWLTPSMTLGASASTDLIERRDVSLALVLALDFTH